MVYNNFILINLHLVLFNEENIMSTFRYMSHSIRKTVRFSCRMKIAIWLRSRIAFQFFRSKVEEIYIYKVIQLWNNKLLRYARVLAVTSNEITKSTHFLNICQNNRRYRYNRAWNFLNTRVIKCSLLLKKC